MGESFVGRINVEVGCSRHPFAHFPKSAVGLDESVSLWCSYGCRDEVAVAHSIRMEEDAVDPREMLGSNVRDSLKRIGLVVGIGDSPDTGAAEASYDRRRLGFG